MSNTRALVTLLSIFILAISCQAIRAAENPEEWDQSRYRLYRGNMHVHTWISTRQADRIDTTITRLNGRGIDFSGMSDYPDEMDDNQWLVNRGACSEEAVNRASGLAIHPLPGFEWMLGGVSQAGNPDDFRVSVFGQDQMACPTYNWNNRYNNIPNGEMLNIENPIMSNSSYLMNGLRFYDLNRYRNTGAFPNRAVLNSVSSLFSWLDDNSGDPYGTMIGQINSLRLSDPAAVLRSYTSYLDRDLLRNRDRLQTRMCLMELSAGDGPYRGIGDLRHYYNMALSSHWKVAPSEGSDNTGQIDGSPSVRQRFHGLWVDRNDTRATDPSQAAKLILLALRDRRTFASENPYVTVKFSSSLCDALHIPQPGTGKKMGGNVLLGSAGDSYSEAQFALTLAMQNNAPDDAGRSRIRSTDVKLVRICEYNKGTVSSGATPIGASSDLTHYFTATTAFKTYSSSNFEGTATPELVNGILQKRPASSQSELTIARNPKADPGVYDLRDGALTLTCDEYLKPFDYISPSKAQDARVICFYALVRFESGEYAVSAPVWTVAADNF